MEECFKNETRMLKKSWSQYDQATLRNYLVKDVQDPRINVQSILTRHWLIKQLFGDKFNDLMEHELRFSLVMNWLLKLIKGNVETTQLQAVLYAVILMLKAELQKEDFKKISLLLKLGAFLGLLSFILASL